MDYGKDEEGQVDHGKNEEVQVGTDMEADEGDITPAEKGVNVVTEEMLTAGDLEVTASMCGDCQPELD